MVAAFLFNMASSVWHLELTMHSVQVLRAENMMEMAAEAEAALDHLRNNAP